MADLYADHNVSHRIVERLRRAGHVVITARDVALDAADDEEHLLLAAQRSWVLLMSNEKDFVLLHRAWHRWSRAWGIAPEHGGIVIFPQTWLPSQAAREILDLLTRVHRLTNSLHQWRTTAGWVQYSKPDSA